MGLTSKETGSGTKFPPVPHGLHKGVCYAVIDLGTHYQEQWNKNVHKVLLTWELPEERIDIEREGEDPQNLPRAISKQYTNSLHKKANLRKDLESWRGREFSEKELEGFDLFSILGFPCQLNVIHVKKVNDKGETKTYANVSTIVPVKEPKLTKTENKVLQFSFEDWPDVGIPEHMPDWIKEMVLKSHEYNGLTSPATEAEAVNELVAAAINEEDDIPF